MDITVRDAQPSDVDLLAGFVREFYAHEGIVFDESNARRAISELIANPILGRIWIIVVATEAVGYVVLTLGYSLEYGGRDAFIDEIFLVEAHRGHGLGTAAIEFVAGMCASLGVYALHLEVDRQNTAAQGLYRRTGFEDHDRYLMTKTIIE